MSEPKATFYGELEIIPGVICDGYVLDDGTSVMSTRGTAKLLGMDHKTLEAMGGNWPPKTLKSFTNKDFAMGGNYIEVAARNSPFFGRKIAMHDTKAIQTLIHAYGCAFIHDGLRKNQLHIGKRCVALSISLVRTALDSAIKEACGFTLDVQKTAQKNYMDAVALIQDFGFQCSVGDDIAIKKDIIDFLKVPAGTLNSFLYKHINEIKPIKLDYDTIQSIGLSAKRMNGYHINDVAKIAFGMDTAIGIELKQKMFGEVGAIAQVHAKDEIQWRKTLAEVFAGFDLRFNHSIGDYRFRIDFFVADLLLCLECNGYSHKQYDPEKEARREKIITQKYALIRFHHQTRLEKLCNTILQVKPREIIRLYEEKEVDLGTFLSCN